MANPHPQLHPENLTNAGKGRPVTKFKVGKYYRVTEETAQIIEDEAKRRAKPKKKPVIGDTLDAIIAEWRELKKQYNRSKDK